MKLGSMCCIKSKKNSLQSYVVLYPDIDAVLIEKNKRNNWLPCILTSELSKPVLNGKMIPIKESFILLNEIKDENGCCYYKCLYGDSYGWIIGSRKHYDIIEDKGILCQTQDH